MTQAVVLVRFVAGAHERDHHMRVLRPRSPDFLAVDAPAALDRSRVRSYRRQIGTGVRLAHANAEVEFPARDPRQESLALLLRAEAQEQWSALPVRHPVRTDRCAGSKHFLKHNVALGVRAIVTAVFLREGHAYPPAGP